MLCYINHKSIIHQTTATCQDSTMLRWTSMWQTTCDCRCFFFSTVAVDPRWHYMATQSASRSWVMQVVSNIVFARAWSDMAFTRLSCSVSFVFRESVVNRKHGFCICEMLVFRSFLWSREILKLRTCYLWSMSGIHWVQLERCQSDMGTYTNQRAVHRHQPPMMLELQFHLYTLRPWIDRIE